MADQHHPEYLRMPEARRWGRPLVELLHTLKREARQNGGVWAWRILPRGAVVGLRYRLVGSMALRIARRGVDTGEAWERELATFLEHLGCAGWVRQPGEPGATSAAVAVFVEPDLTVKAEPEPFDLFGKPAHKRRDAIAEGM